MNPTLQAEEIHGGFFVPIFLPMNQSTEQTEPPLPGMTVVPYGLPLMGGAWLACLEWALTEPKLREKFHEDTGYDLSRLVNRAPIERMVDEATGFEKSVMAAWCDWATVNVWGVDGDEDRGEVDL
jgi:hypothetical protein